MKPILQTTLWLVLLSLIVSCDSSNDTSENQNTEKNKLVHPEIGYQYELHGLTLENKYHWLTDKDSELVSEWQNTQSDKFAEYFAQNDFADFREQLEFEQQSSYELTQKVGKHYFMVKQPSFSDETWSLDIYNEVTTNIESLELTAGSNETIEALSISTSGRYAALLYNNEQSFQWRIYDTFARKFSNKILPRLNHPSNLIWHSATEFIYASKAEIKLQDIRRPILKSLFKLGEQLEDSADWAHLNLHLTHVLNEFYLSSRHVASKQNKGWLLDASDSKNIKSQALISKVKADLTFVGSRKNNYYFLTDLSAPRHRIIAVNKDKPERRDWQEIIAQSSAVLLQAKLLNDKWLLYYRDNAQSQLILSHLNGANTQNIRVPEYSELTINDHSYYTERTEQPLVNIQTVTKAALPFILAEQALIPVISQELQNTTEKPFAKLSFYRSFDGSRIPISILSSEKNVKDKALLLLINNGFGENDDYHYSQLMESFINLGGTIAIAHIRGGATYGNSWVKAGSGSNKAKAIEDILAAQEWLIDKNFTSANKLAILGNDVNSPVIAQSLNLTESKASAVVFDNAQFNLLDFLPQNLENENLQVEYGYMDNKASLQQLLKISPLQNIKEKDYPATLIFSQEDKIDNLQYLSKLQNHQQKNQPMLITMDGDISKKAEEEKLKQTLFFLSNQLKL